MVLSSHRDCRPSIVVQIKDPAAVIVYRCRRVGLGCSSVGGEALADGLVVSDEDFSLRIACSAAQGEKRRILLRVGKSGPQRAERERDAPHGATHCTKRRKELFTVSIRKLDRDGMVYP